MCVLVPAGAMVACGLCLERTQGPWTSSTRTACVWATLKWVLLLSLWLPIWYASKVCTRDLFSLPRTQCFANFHLYLKGREELVVTVFTGAQPSPRVPQPMFKAIESGCVHGRSCRAEKAF